MIIFIGVVIEMSQKYHKNLTLIQLNYHACPIFSTTILLDGLLVA